tara:strand:+ start:2402 stop:2671 length:270 start_codon:yes stop_codon:yes gene_type:complete
MARKRISVQSRQNISAGMKRAYAKKRAAAVLARNPPAEPFYDEAAAVPKPVPRVLTLDVPIAGLTLPVDELLAHLLTDDLLAELRRRTI